MSLIVEWLLNASIFVPSAHNNSVKKKKKTRYSCPHFIDEHAED